MPHDGKRNLAKIAAARGTVILSSNVGNSSMNAQIMEIKSNTAKVWIFIKSMGVDRQLVKVSHCSNAQLAKNEPMKNATVPSTLFLGANDHFVFPKRLYYIYI